MNRPRFWFLFALVLAAAVSRVIPHPPNVTPLAALALFGGATLPRRLLALVVPLAALLLSDVVLQLTYLAGWQPSWGFYQGQWVVYACFLITTAIGFAIRRRRRPLTIALASVAGSVVFFLLTNFAFWASGLMYPRTAAGLWLCYEMALPFFRNALIGDLAYSSLLFGALALAEARIPVLRQPATPVGGAA
jgi:hypothetical protein